MMGTIAPGNRIGVVLVNGSVINMTGTAVSPAIGGSCTAVGPRLPASLTLGFNYIGDFSSTLPICILRSKLTYTQFVFSLSAPGVDSLIMDKLFVELDTRAVKTLGATVPAGGSPRCSNWKLLP